MPGKREAYRVCLSEMVNPTRSVSALVSAVQAVMLN
jgi:hypothetical protein